MSTLELMAGLFPIRVNPCNPCLIFFFLSVFTQNSLEVKWVKVCDGIEIVLKRVDLIYFFLHENPLRQLTGGGYRTGSKNLLWNNLQTGWRARRRTASCNNLDRITFCIDIAIRINNKKAISFTRLK